MKYKGFDILLINGVYKIFKDDNLFTCMCFRTTDGAERVIDTYLNSLK